MKSHLRRVQRFPLQDETQWIDVFSYSEWAADITDRKSMSCVAMMVGGHNIWVLVCDADSASTTFR